MSSGGNKKILPADLSYSVAKKVCSTDDVERLACAFLSSKETVNVDWEEAAREFGGGKKADSFKRQIWVICKKIKEAKMKGVAGGGGRGDEDGEEAGIEENQKKDGKKRKGGANGNEGEGGARKKAGPVAGKKKKSMVKEEFQENGN